MPYKDPKDKLAHRRRYQPGYRLKKPSVNGRMRHLFDDVEEYYSLYDALYEAQGGRCGICGKDNNGSRRFHMDHDHRTLKVRGLLCFSCNHKLGFVEKHLGAIVRYLKKGRDL